MPKRDLPLLAWNVYTGNDWPTIRATLNAEVDRDRPAVIVLNEARRHHDHLDGWAERNGYVCHQEKPQREAPGKPVPEHGSTAVLVSTDLDILSAKVVAMSKPWMVFSHRRMHDPRRGWKIRTRDDAGRHKGLFLHGPTNGFEGGNRVAFAEFARVTRDALLGKATGTLAYSVGDQNERLGVMRRWAKTFGAKVAGHGVDSCLVVGGDVTAEVGEKHGSDHRLIRYVIRRK